MKLEETIWSNEDTCWTFSSLEKQNYSNLLSNQSFLIAVSMKNKAFSNEWLESVISVIKNHNGTAIITLVDTPYLHGLLRGKTYGEKLTRGLADLDKIRSENQLRLQRLADQYPKIVTFIEWSNFARVTPDSIKAEFIYAFKEEQRVFELVGEQLCNTIGRILSKEEIDANSGFFTEEVPVLLNLYYSSLKGYLDVYPGPQANLFWEVEAGLLEDELPLITHLAKNAPSLVYANVQMRA